MFSSLKATLRALARSSILRLGAVLFATFMIITTISLAAGYFEISSQISEMGLSGDHVEQEILDVIGETLRNTFAAAFLLSFLIVALFIYFSQKRLTAISRTLDALATGDLSARTEITSPRDDLSELAMNIDATAEKLEALMIQTRQLGANIAHDLRTPLARLRAQLESLPVEDEAIYAELDRLSNIITSILRISRLEASKNRDHFTTENLGDIATQFHENFAALADDQNREIRLVVKDAKTAEMDRDLIFQALANLLQNALKYGEGALTIFVEGNAIGVQDEGQGVPPDEIENIVKASVRLEQARNTEGNGLGLALTKAIADHHFAKLTFRNLTPRGFEARIRFT